MANAETDAAKKQSYLKNLITSYKFLASYNLAKKDDEKAKEYFNKILELDPNDADVKKALEGPAPTSSKPAAKAPVKKKTTGK
jgi:Tfp pilus assembly protein PilF